MASPIKGATAPKGYGFTILKVPRECHVCHRRLLPGMDALWHRKSGRIWCLTHALTECIRHKTYVPPPKHEAPPAVTPPAGWTPGQPLGRPGRA